MLPFPGLMAMPTVLLNAALSLIREQGTVVLGTDRLAAFAPMFNEEAGAARAIRSLLAQTEPFEELLISINGGTDATPEVVSRTLESFGFEPEETADTAVWRSTAHATTVTVVRYTSPVSKARSINRLLESGLLTAERILVVDGDTELESGFAAAMRRSLYRLRYEKLPGGAHGYVLEDSALQSGAVRSMKGSTAQGRVIAAGRDAEYAFSSVVRSGQCVRVGRGDAFGRSRLFTVVGCGFVARRDVLPMPDDTLTEDHDLTLVAQDGPDEEHVVRAGELDERGFRMIVDGRPRPLSAIVGATTRIVVRRSHAARFVAGAVMRTEDPPHVGGFLRQVERWNGGGIENALKRAFVPRGGAKPRANVAFTVVAAQVENLLGLLLALLLPALLGLRYALPHLDLPGAMLAMWLGIDVVASLLIVVAGARKLGDGWWRSLYLAVRGVAPLLGMRALGALAYVTAATRAVPAFAAGRTARRTGETVSSVQRTWARPRAEVGSVAHLRTAGVAATVLLLGLSVFAFAAHVARVYMQPSAAWLYVYDSPRLDQGDFEILPVLGGDLGTRLPPVPPERPDSLSPYCPLEAVAGWRARRSPHALLGGSAAARQRGYEPLSPWGLLMLGRMAPLLPHLEEAATAYSLDSGFLLQVLLNESYLDPLAHGPTNDIGLAQLTSEALTLLSAVSSEAGSVLANPRLFADKASAYDPEFSLCAGAAKLAWAETQPGGEDREVAYARYINPLDGVVDGSVAASHAEPVAAMVQLDELVGRLAAVVRAYRQDPASVTLEERSLLDVSSQVAAKEIELRTAYAEVGQLIAAFRIDDRQFYADVLERLYGSDRALIDEGGTDGADGQPDSAESRSASPAVFKVTAELASARLPR